MTHTQITSTAPTITEIMKKRNRSMISHPGCGDYECKTCKRRFDTYQALGGHQGTHKRVKLSDACALNLGAKNLGLHRCKTCMKEFTSGQALGGHMRRHRVEKDLVLMDKESALWRKQAVEKVESDLVLTAEKVESDLVLAAEKVESDLVLAMEKVESDLVLAVVEVQPVKVEEDERNEAKSELVLAAKEWGLSV